MNIGFQEGYMLAVIIIGISFLCFVLGLIISEVNKKKGLTAFILSIILFALGVYYYWIAGMCQTMPFKNNVNRMNYYMHVYKNTPTMMEPLLPQIPPTEKTPSVSPKGIKVYPKYK